MKSLLWPLTLAAASWLPTPWVDEAVDATRQGVEAFEAGDLDGARSSLEQARQLRPDDPLTAFNAGTAELAAGDLEKAVELLTDATEAPPAAAAEAWFNLGNAELGREDPARAIEAFQEALRRAPGHQGAKRNLEIARRMLPPEPPPQEQPQDSQDEQEENEEEQGTSGDPESDPSDPQEQPSESEEPEPSQGAEPDPSELGDAQDPGRQRLPQFQDQEDMTAEQAATLLEAIENLEKEQRQALAEEERRQRAGQAQVEKDW